MHSDLGVIHLNIFSEFFFCISSKHFYIRLAHIHVTTPQTSILMILISSSWSHSSFSIFDILINGMKPNIKPTFEVHSVDADMTQNNSIV